MATAPPSPNDLTRQQLDELDALLQRMLSLPLAPAETPRPAAPPPPPPAAPPLPPLWRQDPAPAPPPAAPPVPEPPSSVSLLAEAMKQAPPVPAPVPVPAKPQVAKPTVPPPPPVSRPAAPQVAKPAPAPESAPAEPPVPVLFLPFVLLNALFDAICGLFGPPGKALRSPALKQLYGLIGIGLLLYTAARVAQVQGWVSLPVVLPWPN